MLPPFEGYDGYSINPEGNFRTSSSLYNLHNYITTQGLIACICMFYIWMCMAYYILERNVMYDNKELPPNCMFLPKCRAPSCGGYRHHNLFPFYHAGF